MKSHLVLCAAALILPFAAARADEPPVPLRAGAGREAVEANCAACHSLDYIRTNARFMTATVWGAEVTKMIKVFGAPIR
jgi:mono/diheme cytochrome c family protein